MDIVEDTPERETAALAELGMREHFSIVAGARVRCAACRAVVLCADVQIVAVRRLEGPSDPSEEAAVLGLRCPRCRALGTLVVGYGPTAGADDQDALAVRAVAIRRWRTRAACS